MDTSGLLRNYLSEQNTSDYVDVFLPGETGVALSESINNEIGDSKIKTLSDNVQLNMYVDTAIEKLSKGRYKRKIKSFFDSIVTLSWTTPNQDAGKFEISFLNGFSGNELDLPNAFVLKRDNLNKNDVSKFVSFFNSVPLERRPKVIFDTENSISDSLNLLSYSKTMIRTFLDSPNGLSETQLETRSSWPDTFLSLYEANNLSACADTNLPEPENDGTNKTIREYIVKIYLQVQAKKRLGVKFDALQQVIDTQIYLVDKIEYSENENLIWYKQALFFFLLDEAYIDEKKGISVERALTIAHSLEDRTLTAHAGRMINLSAGINLFSSHILQKSADIFGLIGDPVGRAYCLNNKMVNDAHLLECNLSRTVGKDLLEYCYRSIPYSERLSSICSTVGVNALLLNDLEFAEHCFKLGEKSAGLRLHHLSAKVNKLILHNIVKGTEMDEAVYDCCNSIVSAKMPKSLDYHHTYLLGNLERLAKSKNLKKYIQDILIENQYMHYEDNEVRNGEVINFLATVFRSISDGKNYRGQRGIFYRRYGLLPISHFIWN